jgi:hypothetical protein
VEDEQVQQQQDDHEGDESGPEPVGVFEGDEGGSAAIFDCECQRVQHGATLVRADGYQNTGATAGRRWSKRSDIAASAGHQVPLFRSKTVGLGGEDVHEILEGDV